MTSAALTAAALALLTLAPADAAVSVAEPAARTAPLPGPAHAGALRSRQAYGRLPLSFMRDGGSYVARTAAGSITLSRGLATVVPTAGRHVGDPVTMGLAGAATVAPRVQQRLPGVVNDLRGDDPSRWRTDIPTFGRLRYAGVYPGIDLDYHGTSGTLEYDFRLAPGADPGRIAVDFHGAALRLTRAGALVVGRGADRIRQAAPVAFQPSAHGREPVRARFAIRGDRVAFVLGAHDATRPLVIDPLVLSYGTLFGGSGDDVLQDLATDPTGAAYLAGYTDSTDFPLSGGASGPTHGGLDAFVTKIDPTGSSLVWSTLLGGSLDDFADSVAVDSSGHAYVTGETTSLEANPSATTKFPTTDGAYTTTDDSSWGDVFVTKLDPDGSGIDYSAVFGGPRAEQARAIALDSSGAAYVGGYTDSTGIDGNVFPTSPGAAQSSGGGDNRDGFVTKLTSSGARDYSTYLASDTQDEVSGVDVDSQGRAYVTGFTSGTFATLAFPTVPGHTYRAANTKGTDAFLTRIAADGTSFGYSTAIGGDSNGTGQIGNDYGYGVAVGPVLGTAFVTGISHLGVGPNGDFPLEHQYEGRNSGSDDSFVAKFDTDANGDASLLYSTLLGGTGTDVGYAIDVDSAGNAYVGGTTDKNNPFNGGFDVKDELPGGADPGFDFVTKIVQSGSSPATLGFSTTIPGTHGGLGGLVYDEAAGAVYVGGADSTGNPSTTGAYQTVHAGGQDGWAAKITVTTADTTAPETTIETGPAESATVTTNPVAFTFSADESSTFECSYDSAAFTPCSSPGPGTTGADSRTLDNGTHTFSVQARDTAGNVDATPATRTFTVAVPDTDPPETTIISGPADGSTVTTASVTFGFSSSESGSTFECSVDGGTYASCTSPKTLTLANGQHSFGVQARDGAGNVDLSPATRSFTVSVSSPPPPPPPDTTPPETTITKGPPASVKVRKSAKVTVEFTSSEPGSTFTCRVDGGPAQPCSSGTTFKLGKGKHTISVAATDAAGNTDASPATVQVKVKVKKKKHKPHGHR